MTKPELAEDGERRSGALNASRDPTSTQTILLACKSSSSLHCIIALCPYHRHISDQHHSFNMPVIHVVSFKYKDSVSAQEQAELWDGLNALRTECLYTDGKPYIQDFKGSTENISPEGAGKGFDVLFVSTFPSRDHVKYYIEKDPVHLAFVVSRSVVRTKERP